MTATKSELVDLSNFAWERLRGRIEGLTDEEYLWEPVAGCWSIRRREDGGWRGGRALSAPPPAPLPTTAPRPSPPVHNYGGGPAPQRAHTGPPPPPPRRRRPPPTAPRPPLP